MKRFIIIRITMLLMLSVQILFAWAQEPAFSQAFNSPLTVNPAFTGSAEYDWHFTGVIRNTNIAGSTPYNTGAFSADAGILKNKLSNGDKAGIGFIGLYDRSNNDALNSSYFGMSAAYHKSLDANTSIGIGFMGAYANRRLDYSKLTFEDQFGSGGFTNGPTADVANTLNASYFDFNAGILFKRKEKEEKLSYFIGASLYHINKPKENFITQFQTQTRFTFTAGGELLWGVLNSLNAQVIHDYRNGAHQTTVGLIYGRKLDNNTDDFKLLIGSWLRSGDALIPYLGLEYRKMQIGLSYDVALGNQMRSIANRRSMELSFGYLFHHKKRK
jgi:type IX secretion system PorP/SprF family membrane protein